MVLVMTTVVTFVSLDESESELSCLLVVSNDELGGRASGDVIVILVNWRLKWRGKLCCRRAASWLATTEVTAAKAAAKTETVLILPSLLTQVRVSCAPGIWL